jgi:hypothetical protein
MRGRANTQVSHVFAWEGSTDQDGDDEEDDSSDNIG